MAESVPQLLMVSALGQGGCMGRSDSYTCSDAAGCTAALNIKLSAGDLERICDAFPRRSVAGARYADMQSINL